MQLTMQAVDERVSDLLIDPDRDRWPEEERVRWANEAMGAILSRRPAAFARRTVHSLAQGTYQTIPDESSTLLDVVRNMGADGATPGAPIRRSDRQQIDDIDPNWHEMTPVSKIKQYTYDDRVPTVFYVYPPAIAGTKVEILDAALPDEINDLTDTLGIGSEYLEAVVNYVCYRCNSKDSEFSNAAVATAFYQAFEAALGIKNQNQIVISPNRPETSV
ncbi:MAG TPA: DUF6682 family protein [Fluviicoccus sp.]|nr:DUF6682 family protein [Fluviicoccus sp.]